MNIQTSPSHVIFVKSEKLKLSAEPPHGWQGGTRLKQIQAIGPGRGNCSPGALDPGSLVLSYKGRMLLLGEDYLLDPVWGAVSLSPNSKISPNEDVLADYSYSLLRIDSLVRDIDGQEIIVEGASHLVTPLQPELKSKQIRLANIFLDYHCNGKNICVLPVLQSDSRVQSGKKYLANKTLSKIMSGKRTKIVCWGDSVTEGGDASLPDNRYTFLFARLLRKMFKKIDLAFEVVAVGGSHSQEWLYPNKYPDRRTDCNWQSVIEAEPDLITLEFVNDCDHILTNSQFQKVYTDILKRTQELGAELLIITPHFTRGMDRYVDNRPYVKWLKEFAQSHEIAIADVSYAWKNLASIGLPYETLLRNGYNHPDDRGHWIFAKELIKCFTDNSFSIE